MRILKTAVVLGAAVLWGGSSPAEAVDTFFIGSRALGMAGANTASSNEVQAQYYNPATFGFFAKKDVDGSRKGFQYPSDNHHLAEKDWGYSAGAGQGYRISGDFAKHMDYLTGLDLASLSTGGSSYTGSDLEGLVRLADTLSGLDNRGNSVQGLTTFGASVRSSRRTTLVGSGAMGVRVYGEFGGWVERIDTDNFAISGLDVSGAPSDGNVDLLSSSQVTALEDAGYATGEIEAIDYAARQVGVSEDDLDQTVELLGSAKNGSGDLTANSTTVRFDGYAIAALPFSYGYAVSDHWAVGGNVNLMFGRVYSQSVRVYADDADSFVSQATDSYEESYDYGVDLGVLGRYRGVQMGLMLRNLNSPTFTGASRDITLEPQARVGLAYVPRKTVTLEVDLDLTQNEKVIAGSTSQNLALGMEWDMREFLALRAGIYDNIAAEPIGPVFTGGVGLDFLLFRVDVAGALSADKVTYNGKRIRREKHLAANLTVDF